MKLLAALGKLLRGDFISPQQKTSISGAKENYVKGLADTNAVDYNVSLTGNSEEIRVLQKLTAFPAGPSRIYAFVAPGSFQ